jgi:[ribosomal protein S18]-alanine N-acetyltransferase
MYQEVISIQWVTFSLPLPPMFAGLWVNKHFCSSTLINEYFLSMPCLQIRTVLHKDIGLIADLESSYQVHPWTASMIDGEIGCPMNINLVLQIEGRISGYLFSRAIADEVQIHNLLIIPDHRRKGYARMLLGELFKQARKKGVCRAWLDVRRNNESAIALYRSFNFKEEYSRKSYYSDGEDAVVMSTLLPENL